MKVLVKSLLICLVIVLTSVTGAADCTNPVNIPDPQFRAVLEEAVAPYYVNCGTLTSVRFLTANNRYIQDIEGVQHLTNLKYLDLKDNSIADLSPLAGADFSSLYYLDLSNNQIQNIQALSGIADLDTLKLYGNPISEIDAIASFPNLGVLWLGRTAIDSADLQNLRFLPLQEIMLWDTAITDLDWLGTISSLIHVDVQGCSVTDLAPLNNLPFLDSLTVSDNPITTIPYLGDTSLRIFRAEDCRIKDIANLEFVPTLYIAFMERNNIHDIEALVANPGIGLNDQIRLEGNCLRLLPGNPDTIAVQALQDRGVILTTQPQKRICMLPPPLIKPNDDSVAP